MSLYFPPSKSFYYESSPNQFSQNRGSISRSTYIEHKVENVIGKILLANDVDSDYLDLRSDLLGESQVIQLLDHFDCVEELELYIDKPSPYLYKRLFYHPVLDQLTFVGKGEFVDFSTAIGASKSTLVTSKIRFPSFENMQIDKWQLQELAKIFPHAKTITFKKVYLNHTKTALKGTLLIKDILYGKENDWVVNVDKNTLKRKRLDELFEQQKVRKHNPLG